MMSWITKKLLRAFAGQPDLAVRLGLIENGNAFGYQLDVATGEWRLVLGPRFQPPRQPEGLDWDEITGPRGRY